MKRPEIDFLVEYDDKSLLEELRRIAEARGSGTVTKADIKGIGRVSHSAVVRRTEESVSDEERAAQRDSVVLTSA